MSRRIGVVADDVTGANDIGVMFRNGGYRSAVFPLGQIRGRKMEEETRGLDVIILDTDSRFDAPETAARKVAEATKRLMELGCERYFKKTCSVFRGNIGAEFDSMQDTLGGGCAMVIAGFPKNGRTTVDGIHYVYGTALADSQFRNDPVHPMRLSSLADIMREQTDRRIGLIGWRDLDRGLEAVRRKKEELKKSCSYLVFDVRSQEDLKLIAQAVEEEKILCGSSAIGEELPAAYRAAEKKRAQVLVAAGSLTVQSLEQTRRLRELGWPAFELDTVRLLSKEDGEAQIQALTERAVQAMRQRRCALLHASQEPEKVRETKAIGRRSGLSDGEIGKRISGTLCRAAGRILEQTGCRKLAVAGGDTSAAAAEELEIFRMEIREEIEPGVPVMKGSSRLGELDLVLKSGSFGSREFLEKAADCLREQ